MIEEKVQIILPIILRNVGPLLLRGGLGGLSGGSGGATPSNDDEDDDSDDFDDSSSSTSTRQGDDGRKVSISLPTFPPDTDEDEDEDTETTESNPNEITKTKVSSVDKPITTTSTKIQTSPPSTVITPIEPTSSTAPPLIHESSDLPSSTTTTSTAQPDFATNEVDQDDLNSFNTSDNDNDVQITETNVDSVFSDDVTTTEQPNEDFSGRIDIRSRVNNQSVPTTQPTYY